MKILQIASSSSGNVTYIKSNTTAILIDCGLSKKAVVGALEKYNYELSSIDAVLITHEHGDHVKGIVPVFNATTCNFYLTSGTFLGLNKQTKEKIIGKRIINIKPDEEFEIGDISIRTIKISHDANEPIGFVLKCEGKKIVYITDTGFVSRDYFSMLEDADLYVFESNYDPIMLMTSNRDYSTKLRINGDKGHMSNELSALTMTSLVGENTKTIMLAHISRECNTKELVLKTYNKVFSDESKSLDNINLICLTDHMTEEIEI